MNYRDKSIPTGPYSKPKPGMMPQMPATGTLNLFPPDEGFARGTIFRGLYEPYKKQTPIRPVPTTERERMLHDVNKYYFALHEMRMYLDNFPDDQEAINVFTNFQRNYIKAKREYEKRYDALDIEAANLDTAPWNWTVGKWPWEGVM
ncbi:MAG: spore coat protein CotJB [Bacilli bacterium]|jgi:spore coat protein JB